MRFAYRRRGLVVRGRLAVAGLLRRRNGAFPHGPSLPHSSGTGEHQSLMMRYRVLYGRSGSASDFALHSRLVALQKREIVTNDQKFRNFDLALCAQPQAVRGLREPVETEIVGSNSRVWKWAGHIEPDGLLGGLNSPFVLSVIECDPTPENAPWISITRIRLCPRFESLQLLLQVPGYLAVIEHENEAPLPIADTIPKRVGFADFVRSLIGLPRIGQPKSEIGMRHRELRIDCDGVPVMRNRGL